MYSHFMRDLRKKPGYGPSAPPLPVKSIVAAKTKPDSAAFTSYYLPVILLCLCLGWYVSWEQKRKYFYSDIYSDDNYNGQVAYFSNDQVHGASNVKISEDGYLRTDVLLVGEKNNELVLDSKTFQLDPGSICCLDKTGKNIRFEPGVTIENGNIACDSLITETIFINKLEKHDMLSGNVSLLTLSEGIVGSVSLDNVSIGDVLTVTGDLDVKFLPPLGNVFVDDPKMAVSTNHFVKFDTIMGKLKPAPILDSVDVPPFSLGLNSTMDLVKYPSTTSVNVSNLLPEPKSFPSLLSINSNTELEWITMPEITSHIDNLFTDLYNCNIDHLFAKLNNADRGLVVYDSRSAQFTTHPVSLLNHDSFLTAKSGVLEWTRGISYNSNVEYDDHFALIDSTRNYLKRSPRAMHIAVGNPGDVMTLCVDGSIQLRSPPVLTIQNLKIQIPPSHLNELVLAKFVGDVLTGDIVNEADTADCLVGIDTNNNFKRVPYNPMFKNLSKTNGQQMLVTYDGITKTLQSIVEFPNRLGIVGECLGLIDTNTLGWINIETEVKRQIESIQYNVSLDNNVFIMLRDNNDKLIVSDNFKMPKQNNGGEQFLSIINKELKWVSSPFTNPISCTNIPTSFLGYDDDDNICKINVTTSDTFKSNSYLMSYDMATSNVELVKVPLSLHNIGILGITRNNALSCFDFEEMFNDNFDKRFYMFKTTFEQSTSGITCMTYDSSTKQVLPLLNNDNEFSILGSANKKLKYFKLNAGSSDVALGLTETEELCKVDIARLNNLSSELNFNASSVKTHSLVSFNEKTGKLIASDFQMPLPPATTKTILTHSGGQLSWEPLIFQTKFPSQNQHGDIDYLEFPTFVDPIFDTYLTMNEYKELSWKQLPPGRYFREMQQRQSEIILNSTGQHFVAFDSIPINSNSLNVTLEGFCQKSKKDRSYLRVQVLLKNKYTKRIMSDKVIQIFFNTKYINPEFFTRTITITKIDNVGELSVIISCYLLPQDSDTSFTLNPREFIQEFGDDSCLKLRLFSI